MICPVLSGVRLCLHLGVYEGSSILCGAHVEADVDGVVVEPFYVAQDTGLWVCITRRGFAEEMLPEKLEELRVGLVVGHCRAEVGVGTGLRV